MIVAGFGCRRAAGPGSLQDALAAANRHGLPLTALATLEDREALLAPLATALRLPLILLDPDLIDGVDTTTRSAPSLIAYRTGSVAEAAALAAIGPNARLIVTRIVSPDRQATCAIAEGAPA